MKKITVFFMQVCFLCMGLAPFSIHCELRGIGKKLTAEEALIFSIEKEIKGIRKKTTREMPQGIDLKLAAQYFNEAEAIFKQDGGKLWGHSLAGPIMFAHPKTRQIVTNVPDTQGKLKKKDGLYIGRLSETTLTANTSTEWGGVTWAMLIWPLPENKYDRAALMVHESWHRIQKTIGFSGANSDSGHLDSKDGRVWLRFEWRALEKALTSTGGERRVAIQDALVFRFYRHTLFEKAAEAESKMEMHEGLAEYTGLRLSGRSRTEMQLHAAKKLIKQPELLPTFVRSFAYLTGPAYGLLLDETASDWRQGLTESDNLGKLLANAIEFEFPADLKESALNSTEKYDGVNLFASEEQRDKQQKAQIAQYRKQLIEGPVLILPLKRVQISFDPSAQVPLGEQGRVYPKVKIKDIWGVIDVTNGALISFKDMRATVSARSSQAAHLFQGEGWTLSLVDDWKMVPGVRSGDFTLSPIVKHTAEEVFIQAKKLAVKFSESVWPGYDLTSYVALRDEETSDSKFLFLSADPKNPNPEFFMTIHDAQTQERSMATNLEHLFHEAFHCFQHDPQRKGIPWRTEFPKGLFKYGAMSVQDLACFYLESILLRRALLAEDQASLDNYMRQFIALRRQRQKGMTADMIEYELYAELNEGLAKYVGLRAAIVGINAQKDGTMDLSILEQKPRQWLFSRLKIHKSIQEICENIRVALYSTGAVQAFILDMLRPQWKMEVQERGLPLQYQIAKALDADDKDDSKIARAVKIKEEFNALLKEAETIHSKTSSKNRILANSILDFTGWKIVIDMTEIGNLATMGIAPNRVAIVDSYKRVHESFVSLNIQGILSARFNKPVLEDETALRYVSNADLQEIPSVTLDGKKITLKKRGQFEVNREVKIQANRINIVIEKGLVIIKEKAIFLRPLPK